MFNTVIAHESFETTAIIADVKKHHIMPSLFEVLNEGTIKRKDLVTAVADKFGLTYDEAQCCTLYERINWALMEIDKAGYTTKPGYAMYELSDAGKSIADIIEVFRANNCLPDMIETFKGIAAGNANIECGLDVLRELHELENKMFPKETKEPTETEVLYAHIARLELRVAKLESMLANNGQGF